MPRRRGLGLILAGGLSLPVAGAWAGPAPRAAKVAPASASRPGAVADRPAARGEIAAPLSLAVGLDAPAAWSAAVPAAALAPAAAREELAVRAFAAAPVRDRTSAARRSPLAALSAAPGESKASAGWTPARLAALFDRGGARGPDVFAAAGASARAAGPLFASRPLAARRSPAASVPEPARPEPGGRGFRSALKGFALVVGASLLGFLAWSVFDLQSGMQALTVYAVELGLNTDNLAAFVPILAPVAVRWPQAARRVLGFGLAASFVLRIIAAQWGLGLIAAYGGTAMLAGGALLLALVAKKYLFPGRARAARDVRGSVGWLRAALIVGGALAAVAFTDVLFAVDSIPMALGLTHDYAAIVAANLASVVGLNFLYVIMRRAADKFHLVEHGVNASLVVVGAKMILETLGLAHLGLALSMAVVLAPILLSIPLSLMIAPRRS